jgi:phosphatidylserine/phosphatidylglycerophosphate/cardiolipin synthase-like enzyme
LSALLFRWIPPELRHELALGCVAALLVVPILLLMSGCAGGLPQVERTPSRVLIAPANSPLATIMRDADIAPEATGVWPLMQASYALDARLALIQNSTTSLDLQYYLVGDDSTGRLILRALRDAALRGVRVRLLVDDLYTTDMDHLLLGLAAYPNVEVRLFNPFITVRESSLYRLIALARDFKRLNHRMHNKLFIADGKMAIVGGRNLADEYFLRGKLGNFIDFDLIAGGNVVPQLNGWFDLYWNSQQVYPVRDVIRAVGRPMVSDDDARARFESATHADLAPDVPAGPDVFGAPAFSIAIAQRHFQFLSTESSTFADSPNKIDPANFSLAVDDTLTHRFMQQLSDARADVYLFSPYFIPGKEGLERLGKLREQGVAVRVVTNSLAVSDEPLVSIRLERQQVELLNSGVELYELSSERLKLDRTLKGLLGTSTGRLHAKVALVDHKNVYVGSMNLDPRSSRINTEIGMRVVSPKLAEMVLYAFKVNELAGVYQVKLRPDGKSVHWVAVDGDNTEELDVDPDTSFWLRVRLLMLSMFVPESQL